MPQSRKLTSNQLFWSKNYNKLKTRRNEKDSKMAFRSPRSPCESARTGRSAHNPRISDVQMALVMEEMTMMEDEGMQMMSGSPEQVVLQ